MSTNQEYFEVLEFKKFLVAQNLVPQKCVVNVLEKGNCLAKEEPFRKMIKNFTRFYNLLHKISEIYKVLVQFLFTTTKTERDI